MDHMVSVRLRDTGQNFTYNAHDLEVKENTCVIMEHDRGLDYGLVVSLKAEADQGGKQAVKRIVRIAKEADLKQIEENKVRSKEAFTTCQTKIAEHKLEMKLVQAEYSFDRSKIIFYFTSDGRVDFRNLVKDLAKIFKARIELRQIGVRDETKFFGGYGPCGRQLCCATFLKDFEPVTIKMAKEEGLPLNPPKISGICGRLMCCLNYEYETYKMLSKGLPREGERITTAEGKGKVIGVNVFKRSVAVELEDGKFIHVVYKEKADGGLEQVPVKRDEAGYGLLDDSPVKPGDSQAAHTCGQSPAQREGPGRVCTQSPNQREGPGRVCTQSPNQRDGSGRPCGQGCPVPGKPQRPEGNSERQERPGQRSDRRDYGPDHHDRGQKSDQRPNAASGRPGQDLRNDRPDRNRQERNNNRHDSRGNKPWHQRPGQQRPGQDRPQGQQGKLPDRPQK
jgi:cell fate regulator YaaT (PSP1 superfamily)